MSSHRCVNSLVLSNLVQQSNLRNGHDRVQSDNARVNLMFLASPGKQRKVRLEDRSMAGDDPVEAPSQTVSLYYSYKRDGR